MLNKDPDAYIAVTSGGVFHILNPKASEVKVEDLAHSAARISRYTGHGRKYCWWSVAEHEILVAKILEAAGYGPAQQLEGLLHDASESYLNDVSSPLKHSEVFRLYRALEDETMVEIANPLGIDPIGFERSYVCLADRLAFAIEVPVLFEHEELFNNIEPLPVLSDRFRIDLQTIAKEWGPVLYESEHLVSHSAIAERWLEEYNRLKEAAG